MEEGYDFEYESDGDPWGAEEEAAVITENLYYEAQDCLQTKPEKAVPLLEEVLQREAEAAHKPWSFKCLLSLCLIFLRGGDCVRAAAEYRRLLGLLSSVPAGEAAAAVDAVILATTKLAGLKQYDALPDVFAGVSQQQHHQQQQEQKLHGEAGLHSQPKNAPCAVEEPSKLPTPSQASAESNGEPFWGPPKEKGNHLLEELMLATLDALGSQGLKRLRAQACSRLLRLYMKLGDWQKAEALLPEMHKAGSDPGLPPHQQLEAAAAEVLCCTYTRDWQQLQRLLPHALRLAEASLDPRSAASVRECAARLLVELHVHPENKQRLQQQQEQTWAEIHSHLMAAFRHHQEIGDVRSARAALQRAVLAAPLAASAVDPFSTREGKALQGDPDVQTAKELRAAFEANDVAGVEKRLKKLIVSDPFVSFCGSLLLQAVRLRRLQALAVSYSTFPLQRLQEMLCLPRVETNRLLLQAIHGGHLSGLIDDEAQVLRLHDSEDEDAVTTGQLLVLWCSSTQDLCHRLEALLPKDSSEGAPQGDLDVTPHFRTEQK